jgi:hypothetical protein
MAEKAKLPSNERPSPRSLFWIAAPFIALALYVLSTGPASWMRDAGYLSDAHFKIAYAPLMFLCYEFSPVGKFFDWYCKLWLK